VGKKAAGNARGGVERKGPDPKSIESVCEARRGLGRRKGEGRKKHKMGIDRPEQGGKLDKCAKITRYLTLSLFNGMEFYRILFIK